MPNARDIQPYWFQVFVGPVEAEGLELWHAVAQSPPRDDDFMSRATKGLLPRMWNNEGGSEDAVIYSAISTWSSVDRAILEAQVANRVRPGRFTHVVQVRPAFELGHAWGKDGGPEHHYSVWGEARDIRRSIVGAPVPIPPEAE